MTATKIVAVILLVSSLGAVGIAGATDIIAVDDDGVPAFIEIQRGTDLLVADTDSDGLDDGAEHRQGTDPTIADTDGDGVRDGREVNKLGTDPTEQDTDSDGLGDGEEIDAGTDPTAVDTDDDGLDDAAELEPHGTDPTTADTDGDGLEDGAEINRHGTDPTAADTDTDGLSDSDEVQRYGTDPTDEDTDADGLADGAEVGRYNTNPTDVDTDGDGLDDDAEVQEYNTYPDESDSDLDGLADSAEVNTHGTDPMYSDTDNDGLPDGSEVHNGELYPDADPLRTDIYVEVDSMVGKSLPDDEAAEIVKRYDQANVSNPDGSTGFSLHFVESDTVPKEHRTDSTGSYRDYRNQYFNRSSQGYHYLLIVKDAYSDGNDVSGVAGRGEMLVQSYERYDDVTGRVVMHELGHSVGLMPQAFDGIDSAKYAYEEYPSVMNYNHDPRGYGYSDGSNSPNDFDDWSYIEANLFTPSVSEVE